MLKKYLVLLAVIFLLITMPGAIYSQENNCDNLSDPSLRLKCLSDLSQQYEQKISDLRGQQRTLASTIKYFDSQIQLATVQIAATEEKLKILNTEIADLSVKIGLLDKTITDVSTILGSRIEATYKRDRIQPFFVFFSSSSFADFLSRVEYLKTAQRHDKDLLFDMQQSKMDYDSQKKLKEEKQAEEEKLKKQLVSQQLALAQQKKSKQQLLEVTKNDEKKFQQLLVATRAEMEAIQSIIAGNGQESKVGDVNEGNKIASIISGASACSTGTHLHFEISQGGAHTNPASFLKGKDVDWSLCGWGGCDNSFGFSGSWEWPMNDRITITQGYGMTAYARSGAYGGSPHTGLDMYADDSSVKTVKNGILYRGSIACGGGTLRYVKVEHRDSNINTYYLHVNYY
jgi:peptidoglycan hydrolase CwlO-like protein